MPFRPLMFAWVSFLGLPLLCACSGKTSYSDCPVATGGSTDASSATGSAGTVATAGANTSSGTATAGSGGDRGAGGSTTVICPEAPDPSQSYCPHITNSYADCSVTQLMADHQTMNFLLVVDRSTSMNETHPSGNGLTKWETLVSALNATLITLGADKSDPNRTVNVDLELFPYDPATSIESYYLAASQPVCDLPAGSSAVLTQTSRDGANFNAVFDLLSAQNPGGQSPTAQALYQAYDYFTNGYGQCLTGSRAVLLVTNGGDNCFKVKPCTSNAPCEGQNVLTCEESANCCGTGSDSSCWNDSAVVDAIDNLRSIGVRTAVVGMPSSEADRASLNAFASAGGLSDVYSTDGNGYYAVTDSSAGNDLVSTFDSLTLTGVRTCDIELNDTAPALREIRAFIDCLEIYPSNPNTGVTGYTIDTSQSPPHLRFEGSTCDSISSRGAQQVDVILCSLTRG